VSNPVLLPPDNDVSGRVQQRRRLFGIEQAVLVSHPLDQNGQAPSLFELRNQKTVRRAIVTATVIDNMIAHEGAIVAARRMR
jgi:hypothetical protein